MSVPLDQFTRRRILRSIGAGAAISVGGAEISTAQNESNSSDVSNRDGQGDDSDVESPYAAVYRDTIDSVVLVSMSGAGSPSGGGLGTGFVVDDQHIVTNNHVVQGADEGGLELQFNNEEWRTASIAGTDAYSDLAVLRAEDTPDIATGLPLIESEPAIGREVLALGNPLGFDASVSQGIVSGVNRVLPSPAGTSIPAAIQTDASVNPGNSGGPLVNLKGEVLGVVFASANQTIGFAISSQLANRVVPALVEDGSYEHSYMGAGVRPVGPTIAEELALEEATGVLVVEVVLGSPAEGVLQPASRGQPASGDVIVAIDGEEILNQQQLLSYLALETSPSDTVELQIARDGEQQTVELTLATRQDVERPRSPIRGGSRQRS